MYITNILMYTYIVNEVLISSEKYIYIYNTHIMCLHGIHRINWKYAVISYTVNENCRDIYFFIYFIFYQFQ